MTFVMAVIGLLLALSVPIAAWSRYGGDVAEAMDKWFIDATLQQIMNARVVTLAGVALMNIAFVRCLSGG